MSTASKKQNVAKMSEEIATRLMDRDDQCATFLGQTTEYIHNG
jgi:hypothetical protein